jgi:hypothetical protein
MELINPCRAVVLSDYNMAILEALQRRGNVRIYGVRGGEIIYRPSLDLRIDDIFSAIKEVASHLDDVRVRLDAFLFWVTSVVAYRASRVCHDPLEDDTYVW